MTGALLLFPASTALADEHVDADVEGVCYADPTNEVCTETQVLDSRGEEETTADVEAEDEALATTVAASAEPALADTGADIAALVLLAALLFGGGLLSIVSSRRRADASTS